MHEKTSGRGLPDIENMASACEYTGSLPAPAGGKREAGRETRAAESARGEEKPLRAARQARPLQTVLTRPRRAEPCSASMRLSVARAQKASRAAASAAKNVTTYARGPIASNSAP